MSDFFDLLDQKPFDNEQFLQDSLNAPTSEQKRGLDRIERLKAEAIELGVDPEETEPRTSLFAELLNVMDLGKQSVLSIGDGLFGRGDLGQIGIKRTLERGFEERINAYDVLRREGVENPVTRGIVGFGLEVGLDPLNLVSFGSAAAAKAAGRSLSTKGDDLLNAIRQPALDSLDTTIKGVKNNAALDDVAKAQRIADITDRTGRTLKKNEDRVFQTLDKISRGKKELGHEIKLAEKLGIKETDRGLKIRTDLIGEASNLELLNKDLGLGIGLDQVDDYFKGKTVGLGMNLPFLGSLGPGAKERSALVAKLEKEIGESAEFTAARKARLKLGLRAGQLFNPLNAKKEFEVGQTLAELGLNVDRLGETYTDIRASARAALHNVGEYADKIVKDSEDIPLVGSGLKLIKGGATAANKMKEGAVEIVKNTFNRKAVLGKESYEAARYFDDQLATAQRRAIADTERKFAPEFQRYKAALNSSNKADAIKAVDSDLQDASIIIDRASQKFEERFLKLKLDDNGKLIGGLSAKEEELWLDAINSAQTGTDRGEILNEILDARLAELEVDEPAILEALLKETFLERKASPETQDLVRRSIAAFQELDAVEKGAGIKKGFFNFYVPHRYLQDETMSGAFSKFARASGANFEKKRTFNTLKEAVEVRGKIPELNIAKLYTERARNSLRRRAETAYFERLVFDNAMTKGQATELAIIAGRGGAEGEAAMRVLGNKGYTAETGFNKTKRFRGELAKDLEDQGILDHSTLLSEMGKNEEQQIRAFLQAQGEVKDSKFVNELLGEMGTSVKIDGQEFILPETLANSLKEMTKRKDFVKQAFQAVPGGEKLLGAIDTATAFAKLQTTIPWPAYWIRNAISDRFLGVMETVHAMDPGLMAETLALQKGVGSIKTRTGQVISADVFNQLRNQFGVAINQNEIIDLADAYGQMDIDRFLKSEALKQAGEGKFGQLKNTDAASAFRAVQDQFRDKFENSFRAQMLVHNLKRGDSLTDSVRGMNDMLIDYRNLTDVERSLFRRTFMFYGWLGGASKRMASAMFFNPSGVTNQVRTAQGVSELFSGKGPLPTVDDLELGKLRSQAALEGISFPLGKDKDGRVQRARGFGLPIETLLQSFAVFAPRNLNLQELQETFTASADRSLQKMFAQSNPVISAIAERTAQKSLYFNAPLDSKFLRKIPELSQAAERIAPHPFTKIPAEAVDSISKTFLKAVPDGEGNLIADPFRMWLLVNVLPGVGRAVSTSRGLIDPSIPTVTGLIRATTGIAVDPAIDASRTLAFQQERALRELKVKRNLQLLKEQNKSKGLAF